MESIFTYSNYRDIIRDALADKQKKNRNFSFRSAAARLGIGSGTFSRILTGSRGLGSTLLPKMISFLGLKKREAEYFTLLVSFETIKDERRRRECYREILRLRSERNTLVPDENHRFFEQWYNVALYELLRIVGTREDTEKLASLFMTPVSGSRVRKAIDLLRRIGYLRRDEEGGEHRAEPFLTTGDSWESVAIHAFQVAMSEIAARALDTVPKGQRDFSTLTMALSSDAFDRIREVIRKARSEITEIERKCRDPERVYQINFQCFPLTLPRDEKGRSHNVD